MYKISLLLKCSLVVISLVSCSSEASTATAQVAVETNARQCLEENLRTNQQVKEESDRYLTDYFLCFPAEFSAFKKLFGYDDSNGNTVYAPLYNVAHEHILAMLPKTLKQVGKDRFYEKLIGLAVNAFWQADAVNYLQELLRQYTSSDEDYFLSILGKRTDKEIEAFWRFYLAGPHRTALDHAVCQEKDLIRPCEVLRSMQRT